MSKEDEKNLYLLGWLLLLPVIIFWGIIRLFSIHISFPGLPCIFLKLTGYYCPGCGGTRACIALWNGRIWDSFLYHPVVVYSAAVYTWYMLSHSVEYLTGGRIRIGMRYRDIYIQFAAVLIVVQWIVRNLLKFIWGIDVLL